MIAAKQGISKKKLIIYLIIIGLMVIVNVFIYQKNSQNSSVPEAEITTLNNLTSTNLGASPSASPAAPVETLEYTLFAALKKIGDWPVTVPANIGKADPFAPFFVTPAEPAP